MKKQNYLWIVLALLIAFIVYREKGKLMGEEICLHGVSDGAQMLRYPFLGTVDMLMPDSSISWVVPDSLITTTPAITLTLPVDTSGNILVTNGDGVLATGIWVSAPSFTFNRYTWGDYLNYWMKKN